MTKALEHWEVQDHDALQEIDDGLLSVAGTIKMPLGNFPRRMTVVRLAGGGSAIYSAIALREPEMQRIEAMGAPRFLVVPNGNHRLDAAIWKQRYPELRVIAPPGAREAVAEVVAVDATADEFDDPAVKFVVVAGTDGAEGALIVTRAAGTTLVTNDVIAHVAHPDGLGAKIMARLMGFGVDAPQVPRIAKHLWVKDEAALAAQFREWAGLPDLRRIVVSHGEVIERPVETLETLAEALES